MPPHPSSLHEHRRHELGLNQERAIDAKQVMERELRLSKTLLWRKVHNAFKNEYPKVFAAALRAQSRAEILFETLSAETAKGEDHVLVEQAERQEVEQAERQEKGFLDYLREAVAQIAGSTNEVSWRVQEIARILVSERRIFDGSARDILIEAWAGVQHKMSRSEFTGALTALEAAYHLDGDYNADSGRKGQAKRLRQVVELILENIERCATGLNSPAVGEYVVQLRGVLESADNAKVLGISPLAKKQSRTRASQSSKNNIEDGNQILTRERLRARYVGASPDISGARRSMGSDSEDELQKGTDQSLLQPLNQTPPAGQSRDLFRGASLRPGTSHYNVNAPSRDRTPPGPARAIRILRGRTLPVDDMYTSEDELHSLGSHKACQPLLSLRQRLFYGFSDNDFESATRRRGGLLRHEW